MCRLKSDRERKKEKKKERNKEGKKRRVINLPFAAIQANPGY
jgi:hypothetical protein